MKKIILILLCTAMVLSMAACGSKPDETKPEAPAAEELKLSAIGTAVRNEFLANAASYADPFAAVEAFKGLKAIDMAVDSRKIEEGFLAGFSEEVKGFTSGAVLQPMIGSVPFVCYVFKADDLEAFKTYLMGIADPRWNICTEARETVCEISGEYLLFAMCPGDGF